MRKSGLFRLQDHEAALRDPTASIPLALIYGRSCIPCVFMCTFLCAACLHHIIRHPSRSCQELSARHVRHCLSQQTTR